MTTIEEAIATFGVTIDPHLDRQAEIPVLSGLQFQGDVAVVPTTTRPSSHTAIPEGGVAVVRGEVGANTHLLLATGPAYYTAALPGLVSLGVLTVPEGSTAFLAHPEHAFSGIAPGTYELRRQREQGDQIRLIAD